MLNAIKTPGGHFLLQVVSALQKAIRRSSVDDALYWAVQMHLAGYHEYCWKRLKIIASEDIGPASPHLPATLAALYDTYIALRSKPDGRHEPWRLPFVHAVILCAQANKSRICDHALIVHFNDPQSQHREMPDYCIDKHSPEGRRMGRGWEHFFTEASKLINPDGTVPEHDPYKEKAQKVQVEITAKYGLDGMQVGGGGWNVAHGKFPVTEPPNRKEAAKKTKEKGPPDPEDPQGFFNF
jgi:replication-associated recombination protein RarA